MLDIAKQERFEIWIEGWMQVKIFAPSRLVLATHIFGLGWNKLSLPAGCDCIIDMSTCTYGEPQGMILFAVTCRDLIKRHPSVNFKLQTAPNAFKGYASHVGLFKYIGFDLGNAPNTATGSKTYTPIRTFDIHRIKEAAGKIPIGKYLMSYSAELAQILCQSDRGDMFDLFEYCFREVMRNAVEHGAGNNLIVFGQRWNHKGSAEIVIYDDGIGVAETLYDNEYIDCNNGREALKFAILPGISGVSRDERFSQDEEWGNSGFGLYVTSRFCAEYGSFRIISGDDALTFSRGVQSEHKWTLPGTFVQLRFSVQSTSSQVSRINEIIEEGRSEFSGILGNFPIQPSAASKLLASHFYKEDSF